MSFEAKTIYGRILEARYYPEQKSIAMVVEDMETRACSRPMQIHANSFAFSDPTRIDEEMEKTADLMRKSRFPIRIVFQPQNLNEEKAWFGDMNAIKQVYGDDWVNHIKDMANLG